MAVAATAIQVFAAFSFSVPFSLPNPGPRKPRFSSLFTPSFHCHVRRKKQSHQTLIPILKSTQGFFYFGLGKTLTLRKRNRDFQQMKNLHQDTHPTLGCLKESIPRNLNLLQHLVDTCSRLLLGIKQGRLTTYVLQTLDELIFNWATPCIHFKNRVKLKRRSVIIQWMVASDHHLFR